MPHHDIGLDIVYSTGAILSHRGTGTSKKDALAFLNRLSTDRGLGRQVSAAERGEIIQIVSRAGFRVEWDELESIVREIKGAEGEISDDILDLVAGGLSLSDIEKWVSDNAGKFTGTFDLFQKN